MASQTPCKLYLLQLLLSLSFFITSQAHFAEETPLNVNELETTRKLTKLHFYFHDMPNGKHPTAVIIARPANQTTIGFGTLVMIDDPLTEHPELASKLIGRAQGMYGESSQADQSGALIMSITLSFTQGKYNGSTISILGRYRAADAQREMPIVGGTGVFRLARGYALAKTYQYDIKTGYNLFVLHYDTEILSTCMI